jgi:hypothetical protein
MIPKILYLDISGESGIQVVAVITGKGCLLRGKPAVAVIVRNEAIQVK